MFRGVKESGPPHPENHNIIGFSSDIGPAQLPSQHSMLGYHRYASETPFNGVSLAGWWWPAYSDTWILPPHQLKRKRKKTLSKFKVGPLWQNFLDPHMRRDHWPACVNTNKICKSWFVLFFKLVPCTLRLQQVSNISGYATQSYLVIEKECRLILRKKLNGISCNMICIWNHDW